MIDIVYWINTMRKVEASSTKADFNHDYTVDVSDFAVWLSSIVK